MNPVDHHLSRLFKAAAGAPATPLAELSAAGEARILGAWRHARLDSAPLAWLPLFHRGLAFAGALVILSAILGLREFNRDVPDELNTSNAVVNMVVLR